MTAKKKAPKKKMGRPPKVGAARYSIRITDDVRDCYKHAGNGNLTLGIERIAAQVLNKSEA